MSDLNTLNNDKVERRAELYLKKYASQMKILESSKNPIARVRSVSPYDIYALGHQLNMFEEYVQMCNEEGTIGQLGQIPNIALDVITANYASSPLSVIASVQPIDEEAGTVYFKNVIAGTTRGNVTKGQSLSEATNMPDAHALGFAQDSVTHTGPKTVAATLTYTFSLAQAPVKPGTTQIRIAGLNLPSLDDSQGNILGKGISGSVNYATGEVTIALAADPGADRQIFAVYATDFENASDIPNIKTTMSNKPINARVFTLKETVGLLQSYTLRKRFGIVAEDMVAQDLVGAINAETVNTVVTNLYLNAVGNTNWSRSAPSAVAEVDHRQTLLFAITDAESVMLGNSGRGVINTLIAGTTGAAILSTLPGFTKISDGNSTGPHIFGTLNGMTIIRVPAASVLPANTILGVYNGPTPFESAAVYSPYMPLVVTTAMPNGHNPLLSQKAAAVWAGVDTLVPQFVTKITIT